jgi:hypothetical protein
VDNRARAAAGGRGGCDDSSLAAVATLVGVAFPFGGITQLAVASWVQSWRWLFIVAGIMGVAAGIGTFLAGHHPVCGVDPGGLVPDRLRHHPRDRRAGRPKLGWWWTGLLLGIAELVLGRVGGSLLGAVAADPSDTGRGVGHPLRGERDLRRLTLREAGKQAERLAG